MSVLVHENKSKEEEEEEERKSTKCFHSFEKSQFSDIKS